MFPGTLAWSTDLCLGDASLAQSGYARKIQLLRKSGNSWKQTGARASIGKGGTAGGGRCKKGTVRLEIGTEEATPGVSAVDAGWSPCRSYQIQIPETSRFRKTSIGLCVKTKATVS